MSEKMPDQTIKIIRSANRLITAIRELGQRSPYNNLTWFEAPITKMPVPEYGEKALRLWQEMNDAISELRNDLDLAQPAPVNYTPIRNQVCKLWGDAVREFSIKPGSLLEKNVSDLLRNIDQPAPASDAVQRAVDAIERAENIFKQWTQYTANNGWINALEDIFENRETILAALRGRL